MEKLVIRAFTVPKQTKELKKYTRLADPTEHLRILVFDTETNIDQCQNLKIGHFKIFQEEILQQEGLFYGEISKDELKTLSRYAKKNKIALYSREKFVKEVFYPEVFRLKTLCVGFNLTFDLSRSVVKFGDGRNSGKGGFSLQLSDDKILPRIRTKQLNGDNYSINFASSPHNRGEDKFRGYFLDIQRIARVLTDKKKISLKEACEIFNTKTKKMGVEEHGKINDKYIEYMITDVKCTYELYCKIKEEYATYSINLPLTQVFSSASMGKQALRQLGIKSFLEQNPEFPKQLIGNIMSAYFGGRCECKIRKTPVLVTTLDFTSMYPSVMILMELWKHLIPEKIDYVDDTENVQKLLEELTDKDLLNKDMWKNLCVLVEIEPNNDILPVRSNYDKNSNIYNIGVNHLSCKDLLYYALSDVIVSKILSGKTPKIKRAIRFIPKGRQETLTNSRILGFDFDPAKDNLIKELVERRQQVKSEIKQIPSDKQHLEGLQKSLKILANATSYGIFVEMNPDNFSEEQEVYSNIQFETPDNKIEKLGDFFNPIIAVMLTSGARLLLAIAEKYATEKGYYTYMDTDSIFVDPKIAEELSRHFDALNPYSSKISLLKIEKKDKMFYGISSKRYCLYTVNKDKIIIEDADEKEYKLHGLGHLLNPFPNKNDHWHKEVWEDIIKLHHNKITEKDIFDKYSKFYGVSQLTISTPTILKKFDKINKNKPINQQIKPFNFMLVGVNNKKDIKPVAPFTKNNQEVAFKEFIDYKTGKTFKGIEYWQPLSEVILRYNNHPESKLEGNIGVMQRKHIKPDQVIYIGKETKNIEKQVIEKQQIQEYTNLKKILEMTWAEAKKKGLKHRSTFKRIKDKIRQGKRINMRTKAINYLLKAYL